MKIFSWIAPFGLSWQTYAVVVAVLIVLATLRITRFIIIDDLGAWLFGDRARVLAARKERQLREDAAEFIRAEVGTTEELNAAQWVLTDTGPRTFTGRLLSGLECPFCVGFWVGLIVIVVTLLVQSVPYVAATWLIILAALSLNYIVGHVSARVDFEN